MRVGNTLTIGSMSSVGAGIIDPDAQIFIDRVIADGGTVEDPSFLNSFILDAKANNYFNDIVAAYSPSWGVKSATGASDLYSIVGASTDLSQTTGANQPTVVSGDLLGKTRLLFDGIDDRLLSAAFALVQPETVVLGGFEQETWNSNRFFDGNISALGTLYQSAVSPNIRLFAGANSTENTDLALNTPASVRSLFNGASSAIQVDGNAEINGDAGAADMGGFTLGGAPTSFFAHMSVGTVIILNAAVDAAYPAKVAAIYAFNKAAYGTP